MLVEDLNVYKKLFELTLQVHKLTMTFPCFELYEFGSQLRRSSNSCPANLAEGFGNKHTKLYLKCISRAQGEIRETKHHLKIASCKDYLSKHELYHFITEYENSSIMLYGLERSLVKNIWK